MNGKITIAVILLIAIVGASCYLADPIKLINTPIKTQQEKITTTQLNNGLLVTIKETHSVPLTTIQFWINVGAKNEPQEYRGIAHIFEHIWFKGTASQPVGSFHKKVESLGGELNAMTSYDWTTYFVTLPSDKFDEILPLMTDLLLNPAFNETEIDKEKQVILEEQRKESNEPELYLQNGFGLTLLDKHPYRDPIIGYKETIMAPNREAIKEFYETWYVPNNMNVVIVGDVNTEETIQKIQNALGQMIPRPVPVQERPTEQITQTKYNSSYKDIGHTYLALGYIGPNSTNQDKYTLDLISAILSQGESSPIQMLKNQKNLIVKGTSYYVQLNDIGILEIVVTADPDKIPQTKTELLLMLNKLKTTPISDEDLNRAKTQIKKYKLNNQEQIGLTGFEIGQFWIQGALEEYPAYLQKINSITKEDIQKIAQKYLNNYAMYEVKPKL